MILILNMTFLVLFGFAFFTLYVRLFFIIDIDAIASSKLYTASRQIRATLLSTRY